MGQTNDIKKVVKVVLEGDTLEAFGRLKNTLGFKNDSEVLRRAIVFTEKRDR